ncbi:MAG: hypothetical protein LBM98_07160 [Oscillospiraceae bacterium]|nr:hypothetical protein [Oscillospiraceae bacterium]
MLRTCNVLRIAGLPVLRKDGARRRNVGRGRAGLKPAPTNRRRTAAKPPPRQLAAQPIRRHYYETSFYRAAYYLRAYSRSCRLFGGV